MQIEEYTPLAPHCTFRIGGSARYSAQCVDEHEVARTLSWARKQGVAWRALGSGSNTLVCEDGFHGLIIFYRGANIRIDTTHARVTADAGALTATVATAAAHAGLAGFEWAVGVPGTIGGAVCGNAGAMGGEMKDVVANVRVMDADGGAQEFNSDACAFRYRHSRFKHERVIILSATLQLTAATYPDTPLTRMRKVLQYRMSTQPKGVASCGCTFKNYECTDAEVAALRARGVPEQFLQVRRVPAGWLIEHAGLKGERSGGASISTVHANFMVSEPVATSADIRALIVHIKDTVHARFGVQLTEEIVVLQ